MNQPLHNTMLASLFCAMAPLPAGAGEWGIGPALASSQQPQAGVERQVLGIPYITYQGERLSVDPGTISYSLYHSAMLTVALQGELRFDGYDPGDSVMLSGMVERKAALDTGLRFTHSAPWGALELVLLADITSTHDGFEARGSYQYPFIIGRWFMAPAIGVKWQDESLVDYYYGVRADEATTDRPAYAGHDATSVFAEITTGYAYSDRVDFMAGIEHIRFDDSIYNSPIIDRRAQSRVIATMLYKF